MKSHRNKEIRRRNFIALRILAACGAAMFLWPSAQAGAQAEPGPLPAHVPTEAPPPKATPQASPETTKPNLAGTWKMNKDQSDDPRKAMQQAGGNSGGRGGWGGTGRGGSMGGGGWGGGGHHGGYGQRGGQSSENPMNDHKELRIEQSNDYLKITGSSGHIVAQSSESDRSGSNSSSEASASASKGDWQGRRFVVVTQSEHGSKTTRTYELSQDGKQLYLSTRIDNQRFNQPVTFRLLYNSTKSGGPSQ